MPITSGTCPWLAKQTGREDGTAKLTRTLVDVIKANSPETADLQRIQGANEGSEAGGKAKSTSDGSDKPAKSFDQAVSEGDIELVKSLLAKGANVNARDRRGQTVLHIAASHGHKVLVELLLAKGADIAAKGPAGGTALHGASRFGHRDVVELLLAKGADINARRYNGQTPLSVAKEQGHEKVAELLRQHGAKE
jgi:ankyrin repeat protein